MHLSDLKTKHVTELVEMAAANQIENANRMRKQDLIFALLKSEAKKGESIFGDGTLEILTLQPEGKPPMSADAFVRGYSAISGATLA